MQFTTGPGHEFPPQATVAPAAAVAFAEQIKKYPSNQQGAESMLKLGQSLISLGEKEKGCVTLGAIKSKYKQAPAGILSQATSIRAKSCKGE